MSLRRGLLALPLLALALSPLSPRLASADVTRLELENFVAHDDLGGGYIVRAECDGALNGWVVDYVDVAGEWIEVDLDVVEPFCFVDSLRSAGLLDSVRVLEISYRLLDSGTVVSADTLVTPPGSGIG